MSEVNTTVFFSSLTIAFFLILSGFLIKYRKCYRLLTFFGRPSKEKIEKKRDSFERFGDYLFKVSLLTALFFVALSVVSLFTEINERLVVPFITIPVVVYSALLTKKAKQEKIMVTDRKIKACVVVVILLTAMSFTPVLI